MQGGVPRAGHPPRQQSLGMQGGSGEWHPGTLPLAGGIMVQRREALGHRS